MSRENVAEQNKAHGERDSDISGPCIKNYTEQNKVHSERDDALSGLCIKNLAEENKAHSERDDAITGVCIKNLAEENKAHSERDDAITGLCIKNYTEQNKAHSERDDAISGLCIKVVRNVDNLFESGDDHEQNPITGNGLTRKNEVDLSNIPNLSRNVCGCRQTTMYQSCPCWHSGPRKKLSKPRDVPDQKVPVSNAHRNEEINRADLRHCDNKGVSCPFVDTALPVPDRALMETLTVTI
ncbi:hypothetical protein KUTeg_006038 [Tegillarca granosa]|uniref:Uncharacterized protein n=1 Tax=Tegillarca granosa TaxID=220873 RepID=A0ABQ9FFD9_TEGGR|nr:hypothetical protein KUTeg_006038 [Tegillarca granosa]